MKIPTVIVIVTFLLDRLLHLCNRVRTENVSVIIIYKMIKIPINESKTMFQFLVLL